MAEGYRREGSKHRPPITLLHPQGDGEQPPHPRVEPVECSQRHQGRNCPELHQAKQYESEEESPPDNRT